jgi:FecR protein
VRKNTCLPALSLFSVAALILCCSVLSLAQNHRRFVISARAGGINAVTGQAAVHAKGDSDWQQLTITDDLDAGDRVRTGQDGRVEILLNPGSYLRVGGNTEFELTNNSLANLELRLVKGTAIVEATGADGVELNINISTPHTKLAIVRQGLYRLNVIPGDTTELIVRKGRVILSDSHTKVKAGNKVVFGQANVSVAKLNKEDKERLKADEVDLWSKQRAELLAKANSQITNKMLYSSFANFRDPLFSRGFGIWYFNARTACYTFVPFFYGWGSPYGSSYATALYYSGRYFGGPFYGGNYPATGSTGSRGGSNPSGGSGGGSRPATPPPSGGFGNGGGRPMPMPSRPIDSDTGRPMPRKSMEISRPNN